MEKFIHELITSGQDALKVILNAKIILEKNKLKLPECYDETRGGGIFEISIPSHKRLKSLQLGDVIQEKVLKYKNFAHGKNQATEEPDIFLSEDGVFFYESTKYHVAGGAKTLTPKHGYLHLGFSGRHQHVDQLLIFLVKFHRNLCNEKKIKNTYKKTNNPFLEWKIFKTLFNAMG